MLAANEKLMAYPFEGYWKDVGTIDSLWEANMDLLGDNPKLDAGSEDWRIYARHEANAPQYVGANAAVENSAITEGSEIFGKVKNSVIGANVYVGYGAYVEDSVIMSDTKILNGAYVGNTILGSDCEVGEGARIGCPHSEGKAITLIGAKNAIENGKKIEPGEMIYSPEA